MAETLEALIAHFNRYGGRSKIVVWEHNSHVGDARATSMGILANGTWAALPGAFREEAFLVGFTTYGGTVTAARDWDAPAELKRVRPGLPGSWEALFHEIGYASFLLPLRDLASPDATLSQSRLERAIGVIYRPETERVSHYFEAQLSHQFDAVIHFDETRAVEPLDRTAGWQSGDAPETFPSGV